MFGCVRHRSSKLDTLLSLARTVRSQFNDDWNGKLVIVVDEVLLNKREDSERLKNLSTTYNYKMEAKGRDREEVNFFAKFVLCSKRGKGLSY